MASLGIDEVDAINVHFEASGYESSDFILNNGTIFVLIIAYPVYIFLTFLLSKLCCCSNRIKMYT